MVLWKLRDYHKVIFTFHQLFKAWILVACFKSCIFFCLKAGFGSDGCISFLFECMFGHLFFLHKRNGLAECAVCRSQGQSIQERLFSRRRYPYLLPAHTWKSRRWNPSHLLRTFILKQHNINLYRSPPIYLNFNCETPCIFFLLKSGNKLIRWTFWNIFFWFDTLILTPVLIFVLDEEKSPNKNYGSDTGGYLFVLSVICEIKDFFSNFWRICLLLDMWRSGADLSLLVLVFVIGFVACCLAFF